MSQVHNEQAVVREILRVMAQTDTPQDCYLPMIHIASQLVDAQAGFLFIYEEPRLVIPFNIPEEELPDDDYLRRAGQSMMEDVSVNPPAFQALGFSQTVIAATIEDGDILVGLLVFLLDQVPAFDPVKSNGFTALMDAFIVVTRHLRARARFEKLSRNQSEFMRIVSHDLRSPLTSIQGFSSMLESRDIGNLNDKQEYFVEKILSGITQMTALVDNIQDAGRYDPETGFYELQRAPCDLTEIVNRIVENHLVPAEKQELTVEKQIADDIPIINVDPTMLERAITNLVDNAIKYTPNGAQVTVALWRADDQLFVSVADSGLGISPENQKLLFERHVRIARMEHKRVKGSGLGLFIVRSVARQHGGDAWVESIEGEGSTFYIRIPLIPENLIMG
jgi:signal transduction histidine kinase